MGKHEYTNEDVTSVLNPGLGDAGDGQTAATAPQPQLLDVDAASAAGPPTTEPTGPAARRTFRPAMTVGVLTVAALGAAAFAAGAAGAFTSASETSLTESPGGKPDVTRSVNANSSAKRSDKAGKAAADREKKARGELPSASHLGLCRAYRSKTGDQPGKALQSTAFTSLIAAAGGKDQVQAYCVRVLEAKEDGRKDNGEANGRKNGQANGHGKGADR